MFGSESNKPPSVLEDALKLYSKHLNASDPLDREFVDEMSTIIVVELESEEVIDLVLHSEVECKKSTVSRATTVDYHFRLDN